MTDTQVENVMAAKEKTIIDNTPTEVVKKEQVQETKQEIVTIKLSSTEEEKSEVQTKKPDEEDTKRYLQLSQTAFQLTTFGDIVLQIDDEIYLGERRVLEKFTEMLKMFVLPQQTPTILEIKSRLAYPVILSNILKWIHAPRYMSRNDFLDFNYVNHYIYLALIYGVKELIEFLSDNTTLIIGSINFEKIKINALFVDIAIIVHSALNSAYPADLFYPLLEGLSAKSHIQIQDVVRILQQQDMPASCVMKSSLKPLLHICYQYFMTTRYEHYSTEGCSKCKDKEDEDLYE